MRSLKMRRFVGAVLPLVALVLLSGCAFVAQEATLRPTLQVGVTDLGHGAVVAVRVVDERPDKALGHRGTAYGKAATITTSQDVAAVVREQIVAGLTRKGFATAAFEPGAVRTLKVEIRFLEYSTSTGFWTGGVHTKATLKAIAANGGREFENIYRADNEERVVIVPTAERNEELLNAALSKVLDQLFQDRELLTFLAR